VFLPHRHSPETAQPFRTSITGIDGAGKDTITRLALGVVSRGAKIVNLNRPAYVFDDGEQTQIFKRTTETFDRMHEGADSRQNPHLITMINAMNVLVQARIMERRAEQMRPDMITSSRDPWVDPAVYLTYYAPDSVQRNISMATRLKTMQHLTGVQRDLLILLRVDPEVAVKRIDSRVAEEAEVREASGNASAGMRDKWRHMHENVPDLTMLAEGYDVAMAELGKMTDIRIFEIETTDRPVEEVRDLAAMAMSQSLQGAIEPGERIAV
jgi:thymidylate kinase